MQPDFQDIVDDVSHLLDGPVTLEDRDFNLIAFCSQHATQIDEIRQSSILERHSTPQVREMFERYGIASAPGPVRIPASADVAMLARLCLPARWKGVTYGYVWLLDARTPDGTAGLDAARRLADRAGAMLAQRSRAHDVSAYWLEGLLSSDLEAVETAAAELDERGLIERNTPVAVVNLESAADAEPAPLPLNLWTLPSGVLTLPADDQVTLLVPLGSPEAKHAAEIAQRTIDEQVPAPGDFELLAGVGAARADLALARESRREASLASVVAKAVPALRPVASWTDLGVYRLLGCGSRQALTTAILDPAVMRLIDHADPDLLETAATYLDAGGSVHRTAQALSVHRQTVYHRVQRIEQITGLSLARGKDRLLLNLGLTMAPLLTSHAPDTGASAEA